MLELPLAGPASCSSPRGVTPSHVSTVTSAASAARREPLRPRVR
jgi:hypothetical protein